MKNSVETQKVVTYVRVASQDQAKAGYSLELQREQLRKYAEENHLEIMKEFSDVASTSETNREGYNGMLEYLASSQDCKTILVTKIDKLCRDIETYENLDSYSVVSIAEGTNKSIHECSIMIAENYLKQVSAQIKADIQERKGDKEDGNN